MNHNQKEYEKNIYVYIKDIYVYMYIYAYKVYMFIYMNHFSVQGKLTQHCKSATLLFFKKEEN